MKIARPIIVASLALGWQAYSYAQEVPPANTGTPGQTGYVDLLAGLAYTDNARLVDGSHNGDGIGVAGFNVDYQRLGTLNLNLLGNLDRVQYFKAGNGGDFYGRFMGSAVLGRPTNWLQWQLADNFGEEMTDPLASPTPQNLQTINNVLTGPLVNLNFGPRDRLTLSGIYSRTSYQVSPFDSQTYEGGLQYQHAITGASSISLNASTAHTTYLDSAAVQTYFGGNSTAYDIRQASIGYQGKFVRTQVQLMAGYNTLQYGAGSRHGSPLFQIRLSRQISPSSTVFIGGSQHYSTNGNSLGSTIGRLGLQLGSSLNAGYAVAQPFIQRSANAGWTFDRARTNFSLLGTYNQDLISQSATVINPLTREYNRREESLAATLGRQLRPTMRVQLRAQGYWDRYAEVGAQVRRETVELSFSKSFARSMISFYVERMHQSGSPGISSFFASSYNDDRVGMYFTFDLFGSRSAGQSASGMPGMQGLTGAF